MKGMTMKERSLPGQISTLFGVGFWPKAPGTWGSLVTLPVAYLVSYFLGTFGLIVLILGAIPTALIAAHFYCKKTGQKDPGQVVSDEFIGQAIALLVVPLDWRLYLLSFVLFRLFDILKPQPIKRLEALPGALGIIADDIMAGLYALLAFFGLSTLWSFVSGLT